MVSKYLALFFKFGNLLNNLEMKMNFDINESGEVIKII